MKDFLFVLSKEEMLSIMKMMKLIKCTLSKLEALK